MGLRTLAFVFGVAAALSAQIAVALGLGEIKLNSTLNQPLNAEIRLLQVRDLSEPEILVGLASMEDFRRVGVERPFFLSDLQFHVDLKDAKNPVIRVTSKKPVREPFLNFVVQAQWPSGRLLREYTLLMDLPVFSEDQQAQPVQAPSQTAGPGQATEAGRPSQARPSQAGQRPAPSGESRGQVSAPTAGSTYGPVKASDTLWDIAVAARPDRSISIQQSMIAIQRANPGAFINNNINLLRRGQVLRIPTADEMAALTTREAIREVAYQNQQWSTGAASTAERPQLEGSRSYTSGQTTGADVEGRVKLTSPQDYADSNAGRGTGAGGGSTDALESELAATLEELDKTRSENAELKSRLESLEAQIDTMERLVDVSNEEMRALQLAAQQRREAGEEATTEPASDSASEEAQTEVATAPETPALDPTSEETTADGESQPVDEGAVNESNAATGEDTSAQEQQAEAPATPAQPVDPTRVVRTAPKPEKTLLDLAIDNILYLALALGALLIGVALFLRSRNKADEDDFDDFLAESEAEEWQEAESYEEANLDEDDFQPAPQDDEIEDADLFDAEDEELTEQETEDAVAEAEIYIALAKYDQAEDILLRALEKEPQDTAIRLKLLELYATQQDVENFDAQYAQLRVLDDAGASSRAQELRQKIAGAPPFDEAKYGTGALAAGVGATAAAAADDDDLDNEDLGLDLDLDAFDEPTDEAELDAAINASLNESEDDLSDFDLDLELDDEPRAAESGAEDTDDLDFDFDLELDDEPAATESASTATDDDDDEFDFDLELDDDAAPDEVTLVRAGAAEELAEAMEDEDDLESDTLAASDLEDVADDAQGLVLTDDLDSEIVTSSLGEDATEEEGDADIDFELDAVASDTGEPELLEDSLEEDLESSFASGADEEDELNIDGEMDLSALDEELDAIASSLDVEEESPVSPAAASSDVSTEDSGADEDELDPMPETASSFDSTSDDFDLEDIDPESEDDSDLGFLSDSDETATKLDLARAYIEMGDQDGAKDILDEIMQEGTEEQRKEAQKLQERV